MEEHPETAAAINVSVEFKYEMQNLPPLGVGSFASVFFFFFFFFFFLIYFYYFSFSLSPDLSLNSPSLAPPGSPCKKEGRWNRVCPQSGLKNKNPHQILKPPEKGMEAPSLFQTPKYCSSF